MVVARRVGARQQGHDLRARGVGDPCLVPGDRPALARPHRPRAQRTEVGAGVRLGEDGGREDLAGGDTGQPSFLLRLGAAAEDQLGRDLGAGAEAADADIAAAELLGDDAHRQLGQAVAAMRLGDGQAEYAELGHLGDHLHRDQLVVQVPAVRVRLHALHRKAAELLADHLHLVARAGRADGDGAGIALHQLGEAGPRGLRVALLRQPHDRVVHEGALRVLRQAQVLRAQHLPLAHRQAAVELPEVLAECDLQDQRLGLAERALRLQALGPGLHPAQRLGIGRDPGKPVGRGLPARQQARGRHAILAHGAPDRLGRGPLEGCQRRQRGAGERRQVRQDRGWRGGHVAGHGTLRAAPGRT